MKFLLVFLVMLASFQGCQPLDEGEPPMFNGQVSLRPVSQNQIEVRWMAGSDDLLETPELRYGIWYSTAAVDTSRAANVVTEEGALSFNLTGLEPDSDYNVLVRVRDRGTQYSENTATVTASTFAAGQGEFGAGAVFELDFTPDGLIGARRFGESIQSLGLIDNNRIVWYRPNSAGMFSRLNTVTQLPGTETILEAYSLQKGEVAASDDLFVLSAQNLHFFENNGQDFVRAMPFDEVPRAGTLYFNLRNGTVEALSFIDGGGLARIYASDMNGNFEVREAPALTGNAQMRLLALQHLNGDAFPDAVSYGSNGLRVALGEEADEEDAYAFAAFEEVDSAARKATDQRMFFGDGSGDGNVDIYIFERNLGNDVTKLIVFNGNGDGTFAAKVETDYNGVYYALPQLKDVNGDQSADLSFVQTSSNNAAVYFGNSNNFATLGRYDGGGSGDETILFMFHGNFNAGTNVDYGLVTEDDANVVRLRIFLALP